MPEIPPVLPDARIPNLCENMLEVIGGFTQCFRIRNWESIRCTDERLMVCPAMNEVLDSHADHMIYQN